MRLRLVRFALVVALLVSAFPAFADKRVALLIGNSEYRNVAALANPRNDVRLLKSVLDEAGFDKVIPAFDLGQKDLIKALRAFTDEAADADIALIYYSGHGMEMGGVNYLVPVDAALASDIDVADETVTLDRVLQAIDGAKRLKLVILDACRSNPFVASMKIKGGHRAIDKGLAPVEPADSDTLVAFAAKAGTPALDGVGGNSPFAEALARRLIAPGVDVQFALREVRDDVLAATHKQQEPFTYGSLGGTAIALSKATVSAAPEPARPDPDGGAVALHLAMAAHTVAALDAFLSAYPTGPLADIARGEREKLAVVVTQADTLKTGLVGYWPLDSDTTNWATGVTQDLSGNGNDGMLVNMSTTTSPRGGNGGSALNFNGIGSVQTSYAGISGTSARSISFWLKTSQTSPLPSKNTSTILAYGDARKNAANGCANPGYFVVATNDKFGSATNHMGISLDFPCYAVITYDAAIYDNQWHHVVVAIPNSASTSNVKIYLDGVMLTAVSIVGRGFFNTGSGTNVQIGGDSYYNIGTNTNGGFQGALHDVRIYNRALSAQDVAMLYSAGQ